VGRDNLRDFGSGRIELKYCLWEYSTIVKIRVASDFSEHNTSREIWGLQGIDYGYHILLDVTSRSTSEICRVLIKIAASTWYHKIEAADSSSHL
jgi:hypothetical protein